MDAGKNSKQTQGHDKMLLYLEELVRNKHFKVLAKRVRRLMKSSTRDYSDWTVAEKKEHEHVNSEISSILKGYEVLRKRSNRLLRTKAVKVKERIASTYGLDNELITLAVAMIGKDEKVLGFAKMLAEPDMCKLMYLWDEEMSPFNKGEEIIYLNIRRQLLISAYPTAIVIHPRASKRDVLDYVEKRWKWIESMKHDDRGVLRMRKRKHGQKMIDFIWEHQSLTAKQLKIKLDEKFPRNGLVYYEISKIVQLEADRRYRNLT